MDGARRQNVLVPLACGAKGEIRLAPVVRPWREDFKVLPARSPTAWLKEFGGMGTRDTLVMLDMASVDETGLDALRASVASADSAPIVIAVGNMVDDALRAFELGAVDIIDPMEPLGRFKATVARALTRLDEQRAGRMSRSTVSVKDGRITVGGVTVDVAAVSCLQQGDDELRIRVASGEIRVKGRLCEHDGLERAGLIWINDTTAVASTKVSEFRTGGVSSLVTAVFVDAAREWMPVSPARSAFVLGALGVAGSR